MIKHIRERFDQYINETGCPRPIIPKGSLFLWKWGWPGINTLYRLNKCYQINKQTLDDEEVRLENAYEDFKSARLSCVYGKAYPAEIRETITQLESQKILTLDEIQSLSISGTFQKGKDNKLKLSRPKSFLIGDIYIITISILFFLIFTTAFLMSPSTTVTSTILYIAVVLTLGSAAFIQYKLGIKSYSLSRIINNILKNMQSTFTKKKSIRLVKS